MKILILFFLLFSSLFAHKLNIFLFEENENLIISSYFASGAYCKNCKVEFYNLKDELIKEAKTDEKGEFSIKKPEESLTIKVEAIGGHAAFEKYEVGNKIDKNSREKKEIKSLSDNLIQSLIGILLIAGIFLYLIKNKKTKESKNV